MTLIETGFCFLLGIEIARVIRWVFPKTFLDIQVIIQTWVESK